MNRREFGRRAFALAAKLGLTSVSLPHILSSGFVSGCDESESQSNPSTKASVLIIGTGYGSAVTALRLTQKGIPVTMLEAGRLWDTPGVDGKIFCKPFQPDGRAMWFQDKTEGPFQSVLGFPTTASVPREAGVLEARGPRDMRVYQGRGVGGGSLVNMALYLAPEREKLRSALPMVDADEFVDKYIARASTMLKPGYASDHRLGVLSLFARRHRARRKSRLSVAPTAVRL
jgi:cholesterol oxidase